MESDERARKNCPHCGEEIIASAMLCRFCGAGVSEKHFHSCLYCGEPVRIGATLCRYCKTPLPGHEIVRTDEYLTGMLGPIDSAQLLQSLLLARENGVLTVENDERLFRCLFENGRLSHARLGQLNGDDSVIELVSTCKDGRFVFMKGVRPGDLDSDHCRTSHPLDRLLLDAVFYLDLCERLVSGLPGQAEAMLERDRDWERLWQSLSAHPLEFVDNTEVVGEIKERVEQVLAALDNRIRLCELVREFDAWPSHQTILSLDLLIGKGIISVRSP